MCLEKISRNKSFFKANESDKMAFRSITLNLSIAHVEHSAKSIQLNHASCPLFENNSVLLLLYITIC